MELFVQQLVNGLTLGGVYALIALGYTLIYGVLQLLNFAHGEVYMVGAFTGFFVMVGLGGPGKPIVPVWLMIVAMFLAAMVVSGLLGVGIERFAYRPLRESTRIAPLISALGVSLFLQNAVLLLFGSRVRSYDTPRYWSGAGPQVAGVQVNPVRILVLVLAIILMVGLTRLVEKTAFGRGMRAVAYDRDAAVMMGIDVNKVIVLVFFVASALAGAAGVMVGLVFFNVNNYMGFLAGLKGFTAAVVGGIGSIPGAMLGGLLIGLIESFTTAYVSANFASVLSFLVLILVMLLKPRGLLGTRAIVKV
ncbi:branched-chain amino acid ABC transporter permease [Terrabacter tumescens]|uniref:Branched-chain amino acid ABC transporter permease n=1 Tax=Terrabacter tumescens TaxID=60443 RepID=A0ABQ2I4L7_9MICO|nr:branched-chain amino acid ABC transporter permease [Terrabacter tumescens]GGM98396.1 branched-chain amino acid ABC transporter permease [Terrabacter tumescens]